MLCRNKALGLVLMAAGITAFLTLFLGGGVLHVLLALGCIAAGCMLMGRCK